MNKTVVQVQVRAVLPTKEGCAVFLGNKEKVFIIYVDQNVGAAITMFMRETPKERPLTHDLMANVMMALGAKVIEIDARPSDSIAMAIQQKSAVFVSQEVWDEVDDMSDVLKKMEEGGFEIEG